MGCNLCTLQKREEHYKLLYEIAQVNGRDFSKVEHDESVVEAIRRDPIVVQVLRRTPARATVVQRSCGAAQDVCVVDVCTQTDITFEHIMALAKLRPATPPVPDICPFLLSDSCQSIHTLEHDFYECPEYMSNTPGEVERTEEYEYEEVELCRANREDKLGLTLCYRTDDEEDTGIYVSQVLSNHYYSFVQHKTISCFGFIEVDILKVTLLKFQNTHGQLLFLGLIISLFGARSHYEDFTKSQTHSRICVLKRRAS
ncbi:PDZ domain-containing RING finger protein 4-like [Poecilia latipinna]|uniref:PDZ domain-containing RING finger protein 4-like n=1 Tax=Poecilia latipinna TaxID=48699 RepID=UPI00072ED61D|nr:PREDICTED: PDZ domain-containing RING finger protein 4-like [Poecilia latipinna]